MSPVERIAIRQLEDRVAEIETQLQDQDSRQDVDELRRQQRELREQIALMVRSHTVTVTQARDMNDIQAGGDVATGGSVIAKSIKKIKGGTPQRIVWAIILLSAVAAGWINKGELRRGLGFSDPTEEATSDDTGKD